MRVVRLRRKDAARTESALQWWPTFAASSLAHARKRAAQSVRAAAASKKAKVASPALTAAQRAERDQTAKRKWEEEAHARAVVQRRRATERMQARADLRARAAPAVPVQHVLHEAARRQAPEGVSGGTPPQQRGERMEEGNGACPACEDLGHAASNKRTARPEEEARDARATQYARHIL